jgi:hypothetical protein
MQLFARSIDLGVFLLDGQLSVGLLINRLINKRVPRLMGNCVDASQMGATPRGELLA